MLKSQGHGDCNPANIRGRGESDTGVLIEKEGFL